MKKINILISLLIICTGISVFDIKSAAKSLSTKRGRGDSGDKKDFQKRLKIEKQVQKEEGKEEVVETKISKEEANKFLLHAIEKNDINKAQEALNMGADPNVKNNEGDTALIIASMTDCENIVELLLKRGAKVDDKDSLGDTALMWASMGGYIKIIKMLLANGTDVNIKGRAGDTALIVATQNSRTKIVQLLLNNNADASIKNNEGETALNFIDDDNLELQKIFKDHENKIFEKKLDLLIPKLFGLSFSMPEVPKPDKENGNI